MTDDYTVTRWGPEPPPLPPWLAETWKEVCGKIADSDRLLTGIKTAPVGPLKVPDMDEIRRIAEQARAARPEGDRLVMPRPMLDLVKELSQPAPRPFGVLAPDLFALRIFVDDTLPDNVIEFRDGDRAIKRIEYIPTPAEAAPMPTTLRETIDVYPVGLLADLLRDWRGWRFREEIRAAGGRRTLHVRRTVRYLIGRIREGQWRAVKNTFNGYLAEPTPFPEEIQRCGSGWTKARALRSLRRQYERAGLTMPDA